MTSGGRTLSDRHHSAGRAVNWGLARVLGFLCWRSRGRFLPRLAVAIFSASVGVAASGGDSAPPNAGRDTFSRGSRGACPGSVLGTEYIQMPFDVDPGVHRRFPPSYTGYSNVYPVRRDKGAAPAFWVYYPEGTYDPGSMMRLGRRIGGAVFQVPVPSGPLDCIFLHYEFVLPHDFDFAQGGKLPGLYGGVPVSGGATADGFNGFSVRLVWDPEGTGAVYAYVPGKEGRYGSRLGNVSWALSKGVAQEVDIQIVLNSPGEKNGVLRVWINDILRFESANISYRSTPDLKVDGLLFSSFFGGSSPRFANPKDAYILFSNFYFSDSRYRR